MALFHARGLVAGAQASFHSRPPCARMTLSVKRNCISLALIYLVGLTDRETVTV